MQKVKKYRELVELKGLMREKKVNYRELSKQLSISISALSNKINGYTIFNILEVEKIVSILKIQPERICIYFF